jgi:hypothetical protein
MANYINKKKGTYNPTDKITNNFSYKEFACTHCSDILISIDLVNKLQKFREQLNMPVTIISGYRCPTNVPKGSSTKSQHCLGNAVDFILGRKKNMLETFNIASKIFNRVGIYLNSSGFGSIHVDISSPTLYWVNNRKKDSKYVYFNTVTKLVEYISTEENSRWKWKTILV